MIRIHQMIEEREKGNLGIDSTKRESLFNCDIKEE